MAHRKREKEERKRLKDEKVRKAAAPSTTQPRLAKEQAAASVSADIERPPKRQRTSVQEGASQRDQSATLLLQFPMRRFGPCGHVKRYAHLNSIEEGSYGVVSRARDTDTGEIVALKRLKMGHTNDGFPVTGLREIQTLMACQHPNVVDLREVVIGDSLQE